MSVTERIVKFGSTHTAAGAAGGGALVGIETTPASVTKETAVLLLNAGAVHKVGPFGLNTEIARAMAAAGYRCLRFDLSGQGESLPFVGDASREEIVARDMQQALDYLQRTHGCEQVLALGLCTGADNAHKLGLQDARVKRMVCLDGYAYETPRFRRTKMQAKLRSPWSLLRAVWRVLRQRFGKSDDTSGAVESQAPLAADQYVWELPPKADFLTQLQQLVAAGKRSLYIYSGGVAYYNYAGQLADACGETLSAGFDEVYLPHADHAYMLRKDRKELLSILLNWCQQHAP